MSQKLDGVRPILWFPLVHVSYFLHLRFSRWTERNPYYEILRVRQQHGKDNYGGQNDFGLRCKRHQKHSKTCSCLFGVMVQSGYVVGKMSLIQCGQVWAIVGNEKLRMALATAWIGVTFSSLLSCTVPKTAKSGRSSTSLWSQNLHDLGGKTDWCQFLEVQGFDQAAQAAQLSPNRMATRGTWSTLQ